MFNIKALILYILGGLTVVGVTYGVFVYSPGIPADDQLAIVDVADTSEIINSSKECPACDCLICEPEVVEKIVIKEVEVIKEIEVVKEVSIEVIKEVEVIKEIPVEKIVYVDKIVYEDRIVYQQILQDCPFCEENPATKPQLPKWDIVFSPVIYSQFIQLRDTIQKTWGDEDPYGLTIEELYATGYEGYANNRALKVFTDIPVFDVNFSAIENSTDIVTRSNSVIIESPIKLDSLRLGQNVHYMKVGQDAQYINGKWTYKLNEGEITGLNGKIYLSGRIDNSEAGMLVDFPTQDFEIKIKINSVANQWVCSDQYSECSFPIFPIENTIIFSP